MCADGVQRSNANLTRRLVSLKCTLELTLANDFVVENRFTDVTDEATAHKIAQTFAQQRHMAFDST